MDVQIYLSHFSFSLQVKLPWCVLEECWFQGGASFSSKMLTSWGLVIKTSCGQAGTWKRFPRTSAWALSTISPISCMFTQSKSHSIQEVALRHENVYLEASLIRLYFWLNMHRIVSCAKTQLFLNAKVEGTYAVCVCVGGPCWPRTFFQACQMSLFETLVVFAGM